MKATVIGLGYVGLATSLYLADKGIQVQGYDIDNDKIAKIESGKPPFFEPAIEQLLKMRLNNGFEVVNDLGDSDIYFITVGTPSMKDGSIKLDYLRNAARSLGKTLKSKEGYQVVVVKSTVIPGTTRDVVRPVIESESGRAFGHNLGLAMNPEFLKEGSALNDMANPDRVVIGEFDKQSGDALEKLYRQVYSDLSPPVVRTSIINAEFIKYASNAFLASKISFINTIANIAQRVPDADVQQIAYGMGFDKRIGKQFLSAGLGYGGSCFSKDLKALVSFSEVLGYTPELLLKVENVNEGQAIHAVELAKQQLGSLNGKKVAILGLAFKPDTDDIRDAVSLRLIKALIGAGTKISVYDPLAIGNIEEEMGTAITYSKTAREAIRGTDCCFIVTEWSEFRSLKQADFVTAMRTPVIIDGRRLFKPEEFSSPVRYSAIGLGPSVKLGV